MNKKENIQQILDVIKQIDDNKIETRNKIKKGVAYQNSALQNKQGISKSDNKISLPKILNQSGQLSPQKSTNSNTFHMEKRSSTIVVKIRPFKDDSFNKSPIKNSNVKASSISPGPKVKSSNSSLSLLSFSLKSENSINKKRILHDIYQNCKKGEELSRNFPRELHKSNTDSRIKKTNINNKNSPNFNIFSDLNSNQIPTRKELMEIKMTEKRDRIKHISPNLAYKAREYFVDSLDVKINDRKLDIELKNDNKETIKKLPLFNSVHNLLDICEKKKTELVYKLKNKLLSTKKV